MSRSAWTRGSDAWTGTALCRDKIPQGILDNAAGVGPKGRGQNARVNYMDVRERRLDDLVIYAIASRSYTPAELQE